MLILRHHPDTAGIPIASFLIVILAGCGTSGAGSSLPVHTSMQAQLPPLIPLEHFFDNPEITGAQISPDGQWLSYLKPYQGKLNVHIRRLGSAEERRMTSDTVRPITAYFWASDASRILYVQDEGGNENFHVHSVQVAGTGTPEARNLTPFSGARAVIFDVPEELPDRILIGLNRRDPSVFDAFWLHLESGELELVVENPGRFAAVYLDRDNRVRGAAGTNEAGGTEVHVRSSEADPWRVVASYTAEENVNVLRFHRDGRQLYLISDHGETDLAQLVLLDVETGGITVVDRDPMGQVDLGGALFSERTGELLATIYEADTLRVYGKTPQMERDLARIRQLHGGSPNLVARTLDENRWVVSFNSPTDPGVTYLYDRTRGEGEFLFRPRPWLVPEQLADMRPISFPARDGLTIPAYLSTPRGIPARDLPLVLLVHGGPWARDIWGYQPEVQLLANRGYAVLQVNYRGSIGYGKRFYNAAVGEWAGRMHTDLIDGVQWAIDQGIADPRKVAIYGGSYGGYATLVGLTFTPEVFACGVAYVAPSSLITLIESFPAYWRPFMEGTWFRHVGDPSIPEQREVLRERSPLFFVDRIQAPLMIVQGANDPRVTQREADQLAVALRDRGVPVRYLLARNEGHGFADAMNRLALYRAMEEFFAGCLGGRVQPSVAPEITDRIREMTVDVRELAAP